MNATSLLLLPLASAGLLVASPTLPPAESKEQLRAYLAQLNTGTDAPAESAAPAAKPSVPEASSLNTSSLQPSSGLRSAAHGLSDKGDWQRLFPRYTKR